MPTTAQTRADTTQVVQVLSNAEAVTLPAKEKDKRPKEITPADVEQMNYPLAWLQEVMWECYDGAYGPNTLLKDVEHSTMLCDECGGEGWYDERGDVICDDCGMVLTDDPMMVPEDGFTGRTSAVSGSSRFVNFDATSNPALNNNTTNGATAEPDAQ